MPRFLKHVTRLSFAALTLALMPPFGAEAQDAAFEDYLRTMSLAPGLSVSLMHLNAVTLPVVFQPPTFYVMRARTGQATLFYVQGTAQQAVNLDTDGFTLEQDGQSTPGQTTNISNFEDGAVSNGDRVDGVVEFATKPDLAKPFSVKHGSETVIFAFTEAQIAAAVPPPAPPAQ